MPTEPPPTPERERGEGVSAGGGEKNTGRPGRGEIPTEPLLRLRTGDSVAQGVAFYLSLGAHAHEHRQQSALHYGNITSSQAPKPTCRSPATFAPHNRSLSISRASGDEYNAPLVPAGPRSSHARDASPQPTISIDQRRETSSRSVFPRAGGGVPSRRLPGSAVVAPPQLLMPSLLMPSRREAAGATRRWPWAAVLARGGRPGGWRVGAAKRVGVPLRSKVPPPEMARDDKAARCSCSSSDASAQRSSSAESSAPSEPGHADAKARSRLPGAFCPSERASTPDSGGPSCCEVAPCVWVGMGGHRHGAEATRSSSACAAMCGRVRAAATSEPWDLLIGSLQDPATVAVCGRCRKNLRSAGKPADESSWRPSTAGSVAGVDGRLLWLLRWASVGAVALRGTVARSIRFSRH